MKRGSRLICCGTESGQVSLLDMNTFQVIKKLPAHAGRIADLDTQNNILLTCGFSPRYFRKKPLLLQLIVVMLNFFCFPPPQATQ